ncbi:diguanylate cyclase [bacterium]|nr:diguanylate cyclase [bacterium]
MTEEKASSQILIAEDEFLSRTALESNIQDWGYDTISAKNGEEAWNIIQNKNIRIAILDWMMPGSNGLNLCRKIREEFQEKKKKYIYIILVTGRDSQEDVLEGLAAGADDYLSKPLNYQELRIRLQNGKRIIDLEESRMKLASFDSLTQLWNHNKILDFFEEEIQRGKRENLPTGIIMADIDYFKRINDNYGHQIGDQALFEVSRRLKTAIRRYDKIGRYGGDEMLVVLPNCRHQNILQVAQRLCTSVNQEKIKSDGGFLDITISVGGVSSSIFPQASSKNLLQISDKALYSAKMKGRNQAQIAQPGKEYMSVK